jgi:hypothetical protein
VNVTNHQSRHHTEDFICGLWWSKWSVADFVPSAWASPANYYPLSQVDEISQLETAATNGDTLQKIPFLKY